LKFSTLACIYQHMVAQKGSTVDRLHPMRLSIVSIRGIDASLAGSCVDWLLEKEDNPFLLYRFNIFTVENTKQTNFEMICGVGQMKNWIC
jgi:hypothetical protein